LGGSDANRHGATVIESLPLHATSQCEPVGIWSDSYSLNQTGTLDLQFSDHEDRSGPRIGSTVEKIF